MIKPVTDEYITSVFEEKVWPQLTRHQPKPESTPKLYVLGGQPGAGKSRLESKVAQDKGHNFVSINGDEFRKFHPNFEALEEEYGNDATKYTAEFSGKITGLALEKAREESLSVMVEGTFRTTETPIDTLRTFKKAGYESSVMITTCPEDVSWSSTLGRYSSMEQGGVSPRYTPKPAHDVVINKLASNADIVLASRQADSLLVFSRDKQLYDSATSNDQPSKAINDEISRPLTELEHIAVLGNYAAMEASQNRLKVPRKEQKATERQQLAYVLRSQDKKEISKFSGLSKVQEQIESMARTSKTKTLTERVENKCRQIEEGLLKIEDKDRGLDR